MDLIGAADPEWEYEYAEDETENFYVVLELPDASVLKPKSKADKLFAAHDPTKTKKKAPQRGKKRRRTDVNEDGSVDGGEDGTPVASTQSNGNDESSRPSLLPDLQSLNLAAAAAAEEQHGEAAEALQIIDLESDEPMIMYQGQIYNCQWATSIGTDLLLMRPPSEPSPDYKPLRSFKEIDMLGIGAAKLIASPAAIERRQDFLRQSELDAPPPANTQAIINEEVLRQARFLGRLAEIKASKGEQVGNLKTLADSVFQTPENFGPDGRPARRGRGGASRTARRQPTAAANRAIATGASATITSTRTRRASTQSRSGSTPTPVSWADLDAEEHA